MPLLDPELAATVECRLTTIGRRSGEPREVPIWFAAVGDRVYVLSQDRDRAHWVRNLAADPRVEIRIARRRFEGRGRAVQGPPDDPEAREAWAAKYGTKHFEKFLREALPVAIDLAREIRPQ
jgi:deazaflavin-dependent oxidoreductase (nitroreductase family)